MKNKKFLIFAILFFVALLALVFVAKQKNGGNQVDEKVASVNKGERKILYYQSPMDPSYISDKPGKSPMGMDLVPVYEGENPTEGGIRIDPTTVQNIGVKSEVVSKQSLKRELRTVARIVYDETKVAYVNTKIGGWIEKLYVEYEGQDVKKDDPLLEIYSPELVSTQEEYLLAFGYEQKMAQSNIKEVGERARTLLESAKKRLEYWDIPKKHIKELEESGQVKKTLMLHSPVTGVVVHKTVLEGKYTKPGENLYTIADLSKVWVYADIYEYELPWVKVGQDAEMTLSYLPGAAFKGKITYLYPYLESKTRTIKARIEFDNADGRLRPDMYADVEINTAPKEEVLVVPKEAVIHSGERNVIIIDKGKGFFEPRDISIGLESKDYYEVLQGVAEGEKVVTSSQFLIDSESRLKEAINKMLQAKKTKPEQEIKEMAEHKKHEDIKMEYEASETTRKAMDDVWNAYFYIREALSKDSLANIAQEANLIYERANLVLNSDEKQEIKNIAKDIIENISQFQEKDIVEVRDAFSTLSNVMIRYMKQFDKANSQARQYRLLYCGMDKKYWVQKTEEIGNPYLGEARSNCGAQEDY